MTPADLQEITVQFCEAKLNYNRLQDPDAFPLAPGRGILTLVCFLRAYGVLPSSVCIHKSCAHVHTLPSPRTNYTLFRVAKLPSRMSDFGPDSGASSGSGQGVSNSDSYSVFASLL